MKRNKKRHLSRNLSQLHSITSSTYYQPDWLHFCHTSTVHKILLRTNRGLVVGVSLKIFRLRSPSWRSVFALVGLLTLDSLKTGSLSVIVGVYGGHFCIDKADW